MISGFDKYYQIVKCFRDEDLRADRQPEFTQVDIEMSFVDQEDVISMGEEMLRKVVKDVKGIDVPAPFPRHMLKQWIVMVQINLIHVLIWNLSRISLGKDMDFKVFKDTVENDGEIKAIVAEGAADKYTRKDMDALTEFVNIYGAKGLAWVKVVEDGLSGPIARFFEDANVETLKELTGAKPGDLVMFVADKPSVVAQSLGALRIKLAKELGLIDESKLNFMGYRLATS